MLRAGTFRTGLAIMAAGLALGCAGIGTGKPTLGPQNAAPPAAVQAESGIPTAPSIDSFLARLPAKGLTVKTVGSGRILIELADSPGQAAAYAKKYDELVSSISGILRSLYSAGITEEQFMDGVWVIMRASMDTGSLTIPHHYLSETLAKGKFECQNSSFLVFDAARQLGMKAELVIVPRHVLVAMEHFFFETTGGGYYPIKEIHHKYPLIYEMIADPQKIQWEAYCNRGNLHSQLGNNQQAIGDYNEAMKLDSLEPDIYNNRGNAYAELGNNQQAIGDYNKAVELDSLEPDIYNNVGNAYSRLGKPRQAIVYYDKALKLTSKEPKIYCNRGSAYFDLGNFQQAIDDCNNRITAAKIAIDDNDIARLLGRLEAFACLFAFV